MSLARINPCAHLIVCLLAVEYCSGLPRSPPWRQRLLQPHSTLPPTSHAIVLDLLGVHSCMILRWVDPCLEMLHTVNDIIEARTNSREAHVDPCTMTVHKSNLVESYLFEVEESRTAEGEPTTIAVYNRSVVSESLNSW